MVAQITQNRNLGIPPVKASSQSRINTVIVYQCHCGIWTTACRHFIIGPMCGAVKLDIALNFSENYDIASQGFLRQTVRRMIVVFLWHQIRWRRAQNEHPCAVVSSSKEHGLPNVDASSERESRTRHRGKKKTQNALRYSSF